MLYAIYAVFAIYAVYALYVLSAAYVKKGRRTRAVALSNDKTGGRSKIKHIKYFSENKTRQTGEYWGK